MDDLFATGGSQVVDVSLPNSDIKCWPHFYTAQEARQIFEQLQLDLDWQPKKLLLYGREVMAPRLIAWYSDPGKDYCYSGLVHQSRVFHPLLERIRQKLVNSLEQPFNSVLGNLYRDGRDSMSWHSDNEPELGGFPVIASLSFGATRYFDLRSLSIPRHKLRLELASGSLLLMSGSTQNNWQHSVPKQANIYQPRINLTFRNICA